MIAEQPVSGWISSRFSRRKIPINAAPAPMKRRTITPDDVLLSLWIVHLVAEGLWSLQTNENSKCLCVEDEQIFR